MKSYVAWTLVLGLAAAVPVTRQPSLNPPANAIAYVHLIGNSNQHYSTGDTQILPTIGGSTIPVLVGQSLDFSSDAPFIQEIELARVGRGSSLAGEQIEDDDSSIVCKASINGSSKGYSFSINDFKVSLDEGKRVKLTGLACWVGR
ncbi:hypothetical protein IQ07DRAFT_598251 [Pyrenochaeta sp. DS3sAY3a]|nr:hypothetical protein IQ07DRAFT_598251 [Pyrenochaeta sp. DS3sAY3a]